MGGILRKIARARFGNIPILSDSLRIGKINVTKFHKKFRSMSQFSSQTEGACQMNRPVISWKHHMGKERQHET